MKKTKTDLIENYKGYKIYKSSVTSFYHIEGFGGGSISSLAFAKKIIDIKTKTKKL